MRAKNSSIAVLCLALAGISTPTSATEEDSKTFFAQGRQLRAAGNCTDAIVAFRRAFEMFPQGLGSLRNIAECEEQLGQFASARNDWWSLRRAVLQSNEPKYIGWDKDAEQGYQRLTNKVAKITIVIHGADPTQLRITIDGRPLDPRRRAGDREADAEPGCSRGGDAQDPSAEDRSERDAHGAQAASPEKRHAAHGGDHLALRRWSGRDRHRDRSRGAPGCGVQPRELRGHHGGLSMSRDSQKRARR
jgi:hypothetical protein